MPQGSSASHGLFGNKRRWRGYQRFGVDSGVWQRAAIAFGSDPSAHVNTIRVFFERTTSNTECQVVSLEDPARCNGRRFPGSVSPTGVRPNADKASVLTFMPMSLAI